jgi:hypothetical protein
MSEAGDDGSEAVPDPAAALDDPAGAQGTEASSGAGTVPSAGEGDGRSTGEQPATTDEPGSAPPGSCRRAAVGWTMIATGVLVLAAIGWVAWRSYEAYSHLQAAASGVAQLQRELGDLTALDRQAAADTVAQVQQDSAAARSAAEDPVVRAAALLPWVGDQLDAVRDVAVTVDQLATQMMPSLLEVSGLLTPDALAPRDGAVDLAPIEQASPALQQADAAVRQSQERLAAIDGSALVGPVHRAVVDLQGKLDQAAAVTATGARAARLLSPMLGADGPRTYLVAFQNLAEPRATGGIFGSYAVVRAEGGTITILDQAAASRGIGTFRPPVRELSAQERNLYTNRPAIYPQDVNFTPDFPTAASLFADMYAARTGTPVDGVLAIDPVALSYTMRGMPAIDVGDGLSISADTVTDVLLSQVYAHFPDERQVGERDDFLARATGLAFQQVMSHSDPAAVLSGLQRGVRERRVLLWSRDAAEQQDLAPTMLAGTLSASVAQPSIGVFLNDGTEAKLGYYLTNSVAVTPGECRADGRRELEVAVTLTSTAPDAGLPAYVLGNARAGEPYVVQTNVSVFTPLGGGLVSARSDTTGTPMLRGVEDQREVGIVTVKVPPGAARTVTFTILGPAPSTGVPDGVTPALVLTPGVHPWQESVGPLASCAVPSAG